MKNISRILMILAMMFISSQALSDVGLFNLDLTNDTTYIDSLNEIRDNQQITTPVNEVQMRGTVLRRLDATDPYTFLRITIVGLGEDQPSMEFVVDSTNLYIVGFIASNRYYRLMEARAPATITDLETVQLDVDGSYGTLERRANLGDTGRRMLQFGRQNLLNDTIVLTRLERNNNIGREPSRSLLRFITIISEALRFREIQRDLRPIFTPAQPRIELTQRDLLMTNNWQTIGNGIGGFAAELAQGNDEVTGVRVGGGVFNLRTIQEMLRLVAIIPACAATVAVSYKSRKELGAGVPQCYKDTNVIQGFYVVDRETAAVAPQTQVKDRPTPPDTGWWQRFMQAVSQADLIG